MDQQDMEQKKEKLKRWVELGIYLIVGVVLAAKVLPIL